MNNIARCLEELGCAVVPIMGKSMLPLLEEGQSRVELIVIDEKPLKKGDIILYKKNDGTLVLHRIIKDDDNGIFTVLGDHQFKNAEQISRKQIIAVAKGFFINGCYVDGKTQWYRIYKKIWLSNLTVRRCFLALLSLKK